MKLKNFYVRPVVPEPLKPLFEISYNVWSTWDKEADRLYRRIDPKLFREVKHNPVEFLHRLSPEEINNLSTDSGFLYELNRVWEKYEQYMSFKGIYIDEKVAKTSCDENCKIAYFSMEFGLHESIPIYSGGLGILAGDYLKAASDMGVPIIGIGLLYTYGYMNQRIAIDGFQYEEYVENKWYTKQVKETLTKDSEPVIFSMNIKGNIVWVKIWEIDIGKVKLYLLDTNIQQNNNPSRSITDYLYDSDKKKRIEQEILLGQGGCKALQLLDIDPKIYHLNEGHSAFLIIERLKHLMIKEKMSFDKAKQLIRQTTVFTTHTPVIEGNEHFHDSLINSYLKEDIASIGMSMERFLKCGKVDDTHNFWLPAFLFKFARFSNGVSKIHGEVTRNMWKSLFPNLQKKEIPISHITNGVHLQTWLSVEITYLFDRYLGPDYLHKAETQSLWKNISSIPDSEIWEAHMRRKEQLITFIRKQIIANFKKKGSSIKNISQASNLLNPTYLTIGFARRFATYKRASLLLHDPERFRKILTNPNKPVQIIFSGKAHPADIAGKTIIKNILNFAKENDLESHIVFVEDYDINIARHLVQGVDVWLNTPIKPLEASGTSGIKAGINGVLNLSVLDGWWDECYNGENGWAITAGDMYDNIDLKNEAEAQQIYELLEEEITDEYYDKGESYYPIKWVNKMKNSIYTVGKKFNIHRMLKDYLYNFYLKEIKDFEILQDNNYKILNEIVLFENKLKKYWDKIYIKDVFSNIDLHRVNSEEKISIDVYIFFDKANNSDFHVEIYYAPNKNDIKIIKLDFIEKYADKVCKYSASFTLEGSGEQGYNVRIRPKSDLFYDLNPEFSKWYLI